MRQIVIRCWAVYHRKPRGGKIARVCFGRLAARMEAGGRGGAKAGYVVIPCAVTLFVE